MVAFVRLATFDESKKLIFAVFAIWAFITFSFTQYFYPSLQGGYLGDNDNFMRLYQVQLFLETGQWYQQPLPHFNPEDGRVLHWSRLPDLPIAAVIKVSQMLNVKDAVPIALSIIPALYGLTYILALTHLTYRIFGFNIAFVAAVITPLSFAYPKFLPGNIDHHNIQLTLFALFLAILPLTASEFLAYKLRTIVATSLLFALALLIGLEAMPFYLVVLAALFFSMKEKSARAITRFIGLFGIGSAVFGSLGLVLLEPLDYGFIAHTDVASFPLMVFIAAAGVGCLCSIQFKVFTKLKAVIVTLLFSLPVLYLVPEVLTGPYYNYPPLLKQFWLNHVQEAISLKDQVLFGFKSEEILYTLICIVTPLLSFFFIRERQHRELLYLYLASLIPVVFWQVRVITYSSLLGVPLTAVVIYFLYKKINIPFLRLLPLVIFTPAISFSLYAYITDTPTSTESMVGRKNQVEIVNQVQALGLKKEKALTSISLGAPLLAYSDNSVVSAPYHRNINGNLFATQAWMSEDLDALYQDMQNKGITLVVVDERDFFLNNMAKQSSQRSFINKVLADTPPDWLSSISGDEHVTIYRVVR
ncbi:hypothetical protein [Vibrio diabolicus]|uniref:hypothetical protein n=1 Tax=Vibrio diabolicus TaxID=50719 RepID=UPI00280D248D|nr:hypothetical protein [Vibrio diabolicus]